MMMEEETMANSFKSSVPLSAMVPGDNPRRDFGDITALSLAIQATGGQPINPPVVVRDGNVYRIVDGERRWRALKKLHGASGMADVLVFPTYDDAETAVAMLATDAKQALTAEEQARGFQRMLKLDVDDRRVAGAVRRSVADVRKAKAVAAMAPEQATLDQMIAAAEFDDEADRRAVLECAADKWQARAERIRRDNEDREWWAKLVAELDRLGVELVDEKPEEGYDGGSFCNTPDQIRELVEGVDAEGVVAVRYPWGTAVNVYLPAAEDDDEPEETDEEREERENREHAKAALDRFKAAFAAYIAAAPNPSVALESIGRLMGDTSMVRYSSEIVGLCERAGVSDEDREAVEHCPASRYEALAYLGRLTTWRADWYEQYVRLYSAACGCISMTEDDTWLYAYAVHLQVESSKEDE